MGSAHFFSFRYLEELKVINCRELKSIISVTIQTSLPPLRKLFISECEELEEIIAENEDPQNLSNAQVCFPKLEQLTVKGCHKLKSIYSTTMAIELPQLKYLKISKCAQLEEIFRCEHIEDSSINNRQEFMLPNLTKIILSELPRLADICRGFTLHAGELISVTIVECPKFTPILGASVQQSQEGSGTNETCGSQLSNDVSKLQILTLKNLPQLALTWMGSAHFFSFQYLVELKVINCRELKSIISVTIQTSLPLLRKLFISKCEELEEIIAENEDPQNLSDAQVCFPKLGELWVRGCHKLKSIFSTTMAIALPQLESLFISDCAQLEEIFRCEHIEDSSINNRKEFMPPNLGKVLLSQLPRLVDICQGFTLHERKLYHVAIVECPKFTPILGASSVQQSQEEISAVQAILNVKMQFPPNEEQGVSNLEGLYLEGLPDLVFIWKGPALISFQLLRYLNVYGCIKLRSIFSVAVIRSLPLLEKLYIKNCEELEEIISVGEDKEPHLPNPSNSRPHQPCFPKLDNLYVEGCNKLKCVFPVSISGDLPCLTDFKIKKCSQLEQVFGCAPENHDEEMMELALQNLEILRLEELPSLTNICRGFESRLQLKALWNCRVNDCPNFHSTTIPALHKSTIDSTMSNDDSDDEEEEINLNEAIEKGFDEEEAVLM